MKKEPRNLILEKWIDDFSLLFAKETMKVMKDAKRPKGTGMEKEITEAIQTRFLGSFIEALIVECLSEHVDKDSMSNKEKFKLTSASFSKLKESIQNEVADAFKKAFKHWIGKDVDYYCEITPAPEPKNKLLC